MPKPLLKIGAVCHENIARSQILHHYIERYAGERGLPVEVFSCGTAGKHTYLDVCARLHEVEAELAQRGLHVEVQRTWWSEEACERLRECDIILAADRARRQDVVERLGCTVARGRVWLFYEFIGEGEKDFVDTYDPVRGAQDPERFAACFDELDRIARLVVARVGTVLAKQGSQSI